MDWQIRVPDGDLTIPVEHAFLSRLCSRWIARSSGSSQ